MSDGNNGSNGSGSFDAALAAHAAAKAARDPVAFQRQQLAPVRARALEYLDAFHRAAAEARPGVEAALAMYNRAFTEAGIRHPSLRAAIVAALTLLDNGANGFRSVVAEIDNLSAYAVGQGHQRFIAPRLEAFRPNIGEVTTLSNRVALLVKDLEQMVRTAPLG